MTFFPFFRPSGSSVLPSLRPFFHLIVSFPSTQPSFLDLLQSCHGWVCRKSFLLHSVMSYVLHGVYGHPHLTSVHCFMFLSFYCLVMFCLVLSCLACSILFCISFFLYSIQHFSLTLTFLHTFPLPTSQFLTFTSSSSFTLPPFNTYVRSPCHLFILRSLSFLSFDFLFFETFCLFVLFTSSFLTSSLSSQVKLQLPYKPSKKRQWKWNVFFRQCRVLLGV